MHVGIESGHKDDLINQGSKEDSRGNVGSKNDSETENEGLLGNKIWKSNLDNNDI